MKSFYVVLVFVCSVVITNPVFAQNKVVVVPLGGDDAPRFRIVAQNPDTPWEGRLEYSVTPNPVDNSWGTVCDDIFDQNNNAANAICQDLGYTGGEVLLADDVVDGGQALPIALDDVSCPDDATSFSQCTSKFLMGGCTHSEDVGVLCDAPATVLEAGQFIIIPEPGGLGPNDGRLEYRSNLTPILRGTVCDDDFDDNDNAANAICQDIGFNGGVIRDNFEVTNGAGAIAFDDITCGVGASSLEDCSFRFFSHNCSHGEDVGVICGVEARIASEYFNYADDPLSGQGNGLGWSNSWDGTLNVSNGVAQASGSEFSLRTLSNPVSAVAGNSLYVSFDFSATAGNFAGLSLFANTAERVFFGLNFNTNQLGINTPLDGGYNGANSTAGPPSTTLQRLVGAVEFGVTETVLQLYVNGSQVDTVTVPTVAFGGVALDRVRLGSGTPTAQFDNLFFSTERCDVLECPSM